MGALNADVEVINFPAKSHSGVDILSIMRGCSRPLASTYVEMMSLLVAVLVLIATIIIFGIIVIARVSSGFNAVSKQLLKRFPGPSDVELDELRKYVMLFED